MSGPPRRPGPAAGPARAPGPERARTATVALRGAAAAYPNRPGPVIRDLDLELALGRLVALAGPSGSGKTLAVLALLRFLDLTAGNLSIDGTDARARSPGEVRALLAWSPEQPTLFPASLRANLCVGAPHAADRQITDLLQQPVAGPAGTGPRDGARALGPPGLGRRAAAPQRGPGRAGRPAGPASGRTHQAPRRGHGRRCAPRGAGTRGGPVAAVDHPPPGRAGLTPGGSPPQRGPAECIESAA